VRLSAPKLHLGHRERRGERQAPAGGGPRDQKQCCARSGFTLTEC